MQLITQTNNWDRDVSRTAEGLQLSAGGEFLVLPKALLALLVAYGSCKLYTGYGGGDKAVDVVIG